MDFRGRLCVKIAGENSGQFYFEEEQGVYMRNGQTAYTNGIGLPQLGTVSRFLRDLIGDDALFEAAVSQTNTGKKEKNSYIKAWDRLCKEDKTDYEDYAFASSKGIIAPARLFL